MAEKAIAGSTLLITLTYRDVNGEKPLGARHFEYSDVMRFLKNLRRQYEYKYKTNGEIRFICAGERGSRKDRVHYHIVLFSDKPIEGIGNLQKFDRRKNNRNEWSLWPYGHINVVEPDEAGMLYVLKYALKEQFNVVKSKGHKRFSKSENHSAGLFRMSKHPPIGQRFLETKINQLRYINATPVDFRIQIPGTKGYWYLNGPLAEWYAGQMYTLNEDIKNKTGRNAPQWSSLLRSVESRQKILEILEHGEKIEKNDAFEWDARYKTYKQIRERCGNKTPCIECRRKMGQDEKARYARWFEVNKPKNWAIRSTDDGYRHGYEPNHFCEKRHEQAVRTAFTEAALKGNDARDV